MPHAVTKQKFHPSEETRICDQDKWWYLLMDPNKTPERSL